MKLDLGAIAIPVDQYASQGNAVLGIRGSGKSYTATYIAERLDDAGIPFIAYDPIGIWRFLRVPAKASGQGYKVVVAGGAHGDIPLPVHGAAEITRAAMKEGVSIIFDLYDISLSKADWRRVVESSLKVLLYENKAYGLRHVFLEEAAEFCPQRVQPDQGGVYSAVERLARMGGNAQLGYTLINQRAEEVNKAVLELCDLLILHRQKGRNSLTALGKWLDVAMVKGKIAEEVPALANGEAYVWPAGDEPPVKTKIPAKRTFHPDRKVMQKGAAIEAKSADVSAFVTTMRANLEQLTREAQENDPKWLKAELAKLRKSGGSPAKADPDPAVIADAEKRGYALAMRTMQPIADRLDSLGTAITETITGFREDLARLAKTAPAAAPSTGREVARYEVRQAPAPRPVAAARATGVPGPQQRILDALAWLESVGITEADRVRTAMFADQSSRSSAFERHVSALKGANLIDYPRPGVLMLTSAGRTAANTPEGKATTEALHAAIRNQVAPPQWKILAALIEVYPRDLSRAELGDRAAQSSGSSAFERHVSTLRALGFIDYPATGRVVALPVLFLNG